MPNKFKNIVSFCLSNVSLFFECISNMLITFFRNLFYGILIIMLLIPILFEKIILENDSSIFSPLDFSLNF